ncbi:KPN_02809 family neutral zinc metallopeptidase [Chthonobacter albigriseus]|uniref:KPN_02809 family neutral zinc metallopeptidase n=1 Tax=Chthonobacter albigriseus TaxID=1683161 RepID=UPI0015EE3AEB|nr:neutral zinc metallopeptidase [Chthonobacter albigriseus]
MRWRGRRQSDNFEDARGTGGGGPDGGFGRSGGGFRLPGGLGGGGVRRAGAPSIGMIVIVMIVLWLLGINPLTVLTGGGLDGSTGGSTMSFDQARPPAQSAEDDDLVGFVRTVLAETEDTWSQRFGDSGETYQAPTLRVFSGQDQTACGFASAASGPFYCPGDQKVYIDLGFYRELRQKFDAPGDFAQAYVVAHEVGHHVQNLIGVLPEFNRLRRTMSEGQANQMSVRVELQADCFAGIWAHDAQARGLLEIGDLDEAMNAATQIGDDAIQKRTQGYVVPESFNHGTSEQRKRWFRKGFESGQVDACNTFDATSL